MKRVVYRVHVYFSAYHFLYRQMRTLIFNLEFSIARPVRINLPLFSTVVPARNINIIAGTMVENKGKLILKVNCIYGVGNEQNTQNTFVCVNFFY